MMLRIHAENKLILLQFWMAMNDKHAESLNRCVIVLKKKGLGSALKDRMPRSRPTLTWR